MLTHLKKGIKGRNQEGQSEHSKESEICTGAAGNGPALRIAWKAKDRGEHIVLIDDEATLREIINQCESVLLEREKDSSLFRRAK